MVHWIWHATCAAIHCWVVFKTWFFEICEICISCRNIIPGGEDEIMWFRTVFRTQPCMDVVINFIIMMNFLLWPKMANKMPNVWTRKCSDDHRGDFETDQAFSETDKNFSSRILQTFFNLNFVNIDYRLREILLYVSNVDTWVMLL